MNSTRIELNGQKYEIGRMPPLTQFHLSRRLAPIIASMGISIHTLQTAAKADITDFVPVLGPVTDMLAKMPDDEANYIIFTCLGVVRRQQGEKFAPITTGTNMMFEDIDMVMMIRLVVEVVKGNLGSFLQGLFDDKPSASS